MVDNPASGHGAKDRERYKSKIADQLRGRVKDVIAGTDVIGAPDGQKVRIRVNDIHEPRFRRPRAGKIGGVGQGEGGDPIATVPADGGGRGGAGSEHDDGSVYVDVPLAEVADWIFAELDLPNLTSKRGAEEDASDALTARGRRGATMDKRRTLLLHRMREVASGHDEPWSEHDLVYRRWRETSTPSIQSVVVLVRDCSGSITSDMQYTIRVACWWVVLWLRRQYPLVRVRFALHDTGASEVTEEEFFQGRTMGGTAISSGLLLAEKILLEYPREYWNRYVLFFSDGDNWDNDDPEMLRAVSRLAAEVELLAYGQLESHSSGVMTAMSGIGGPSVRYGYLTTTAQIAPWLRTIFGSGGDA